MIVLACSHRYRNRYRCRNRLLHTSKTDWDCDRDPDTDIDGFLPLFSGQSPKVSLQNPVFSLRIIFHYLILQNGR